MPSQRSFARMVFFFLLSASCLLPPAFGQSATATLSGTVEDQNGAVVPGVELAVLNVETYARRQATTNETGYFTVPLLPPGRYTVTARREGFARVEIPNVVLNVGDQKALQIQLKAGDVNATVQVTSEASLVNTSPAVGTVVDRQFVENIPLNGRSLQSLIALTPGVVIVPGSSFANTAGQFSVNGQRASANSFMVDGVSANFAAQPGFFGQSSSTGNLPGLTAFGTTQTLASVDAMQEFKVQTSTYSAEYGRQPGGQISIVTRSGTNEFHGSLFDYVRNDVFDANDWFANASSQPKPPMRQNDFGGTFSGPVLLPRFGEGGGQPGYNGRNRTFFFLSYEGLRLRLPKFALTNVPTTTLRQTAPIGLQPILNAFPKPNGSDLGNGLAEFRASYSDPSSLDALSIRVDHTFRNITIFGRYNRVPSQVSVRDVTNLSVINPGDLRATTITLGMTAFLTKHTINDFRFNYSGNQARQSTTQDSFGGTAPVARSALIPSQFDSNSANGIVGFIFPGVTAIGPPRLALSSSVSDQHQLNIVDSLSYSVGSHELKVGFDYRRLTPINDSQSFFANAFLFSASQVLSGTAGFFQFGSTLPTKPIVTNFSAYTTDNWKVTPRMTLNFGLRWEVNPAPTEADGKMPLAVNQVQNLSTMDVLPLGTKRWKTTYPNFAPRFGLAYQVSQRPGFERVLRGGIGVFYDTGSDSGAAGFSQYPFGASTFLFNVTYPVPPGQLVLPPIPFISGIAPPYPTLTVIDPALKLPYTLEWNASIQQGLNENQALTISYVGASARRLLQVTRFSLNSINPRFTSVFLTRNKATSDYHGLQASFQRRLSRRLQALISYTWSHALDDDSTNSAGRAATRGNADFDIRHVFAAAATYDIPAPRSNSFSRALLGGWSIDTKVHAQTAFPVDLVANILTDPATGSSISVRPNVISGIPLYLFGPQYPGGRTINNTVPTAAQIAAAGCAPLSPSTPAKGPFCTPPPGQSGNLGRNQVRGLPAWQVDLALRREFKLIEKLKLQFRAEAFNVFNHPNFGAIQTSLGAANFGQATNMMNRQLGGISPLYQIGGPRSMQFAFKLIF